MNEWKPILQKMIDWLEENIENEPTLLKMSEVMGYSPTYCSYIFHTVTGMTLKSYVAGRRLCYSAIAVRDTDERILDIALRYGYSSQEALTRAFVKAFACTPAAYRRQPVPIKLSIRQVVVSPEDFDCKGDFLMSNIKAPQMVIEYIPAHKYVGIFEEKATYYGDFWKYHDCDDVCGVIESMRNVSDPIVCCHVAGWRLKGDKRHYFYGFGVPADYSGVIPEGFEIVDVPAGYYAKFFHPQFDYLKDNCDVMGAVEKMAWSFDPTSMGWEWDEPARLCYQRHNPEIVGYQVLRPIKRIAK